MTSPTTVPSASRRYVAPAPGNSGWSTDGVTRLRSLDAMRGVIMLLMAVDHVRVYSGLPADATTYGLFFTRWITHFCAPGFALLAGAAAYLHGVKLGNVSALSRYLATRGALLVLLELTVIRVSWTFTPQLLPPFAGVIWMLGWSMIVLAALVRLRPAIVGAIGVAIILGQQLFGVLPSMLPEAAARAVRPVWQVIYPVGERGDAITVLYVLVPWVGVMAAGYGLGRLLTLDPVRRDRLSLRIGVGATLLFLAIAGTLASLAPAPSGSGPAPAAPWLVRLLNQQKYPASQLFLLMTLGPIIALLPAAGRLRGRGAEVLQTIGRVPLFYYLLHIPLIHLSALVVNAVRTGSAHGEWYEFAPFSWVPPAQRWPLWLLYVVLLVDACLLYAACRWYDGVKRRRPASWLRYL